jgi:hypothetical protein
MKKVSLFLCLFTSLLVVAKASPLILSRGVMNHKKVALKTDTISGVFLYEFNVTEKCYQRFDQIERTRNLIRYTDEIKDLDISQLYDRGIYILFYENFLSNIISKYKLWQNRKNVDGFVGYMVRHSGEEYDQNIIYDKSGILSFKKIYIKMVVCDLNKRRQLTPRTKNYVCCYSNLKRAIPTYFVTDIIDFKVL